MYNYWNSANKVTDNNKSSQLASDLLLPIAGFRNQSNAYSYNEGTYGYYWSSTYYSDGSAYIMYFTSSSVNSDYPNARARGIPVRCFKNTQTQTMNVYPK
ncbi:hypothetical protein J6V86_00145 [bacterium]|nr:hypothetical protein [bacterium]